MDLYKILGLDRNATIADVKAAFKRKAKQTHPDAGGDPEQFRQVALAHRILSDDKRRQKYDETGETTENLDTLDGQAIAIIGGLVDEIVNRLVAGDDMAHEDLAAWIVSSLRKRIDDTKRDIGHAETFIGKATKLCKRFRAKSGPNYVANMVGQKTEAAEKAIAAGRERIAVLERAVEIASDVECDFDAASTPPYDGIKSQMEQFARSKTFRYSPTWWP